MNARISILICFLSVVFNFAPPDAVAATVIRTISQTNTYMVFDAGRERIYVSVPNAGTNYRSSVIALDPKTGTVEWSVAISNSPSFLALSDDGQYLYAGLAQTNEVARVNLAARAVDLRFPLGRSPSNAPLYAARIKVMPGFPQTVAVVRQDIFLSDGFPAPGRSTVFADITLYDNGVPRSQTSGSLVPRFSTLDPKTTIEFNADGSRLYLFMADAGLVPGIFQTYRVDAEGLSYLSSVSSDSASGSEMKFYGGLIYFSSGLVWDPARNVRMGQFGRPETNSSNPFFPTITKPTVPFAIDAAKNRAFFYLAASSSQIGGVSFYARLLAFDFSTFCPVGFITITNLALTKVTPSGPLLRWGTNGLAYHDTNRIYLVETPLIRAESSADLAVSQRKSADPVGVGTNLAFTIVVTNKGPAAAREVRMTNTLSTGLTFVSAITSQGVFTTNASQNVFTLGTISNRASATITLTARATSAGIRSNVCAVFSPSDDPDDSNNSATEMVNVQSALSTNLISVLALVANDLAYDSARQRIYASVPSIVGSFGNSIAIINARTREIVSYLFIGSEPGKLAISDDAQFLYVTLNGAQAIRRLDLAALTAGAPFWPGGTIKDVKAQPGNARTLAVSDGAIRLFDDGVPRPNIFYDGTQSSSIEFGFGDALYALNGTNGFRRLWLNEHGISIFERFATVVTGVSGEMKFQDGRLYFSSGRVMDAATKTVIGNFGFSGQFEPDAAQGRVFVVLSSIPSTLRAYDLNTFALIGSVPLPSFSGTVTNLIRCGENGIAFQNSNQVFLVRSPLINPLAMDSDNDGIPDEWEIANGLDTLDAADALADADGDGVSNLDEFRCGTSPCDARSVLRLNSAVVAPDGIRLDFSVMANKSYEVERSRDLVNWISVTNILSGASERLQITDSPTHDEPQLFYRLRLRE